MAVRRILRIDDPEDKKILKTRCRPIKLPDPKLKHLIADMFETMHEANGVGLAAPQVGLSIRLAIVETPAITEELEDGTQIEVEPASQHVLLNPRIVKFGPEELMRQEGCLSLPGWFGEVPRANWVTLEYQEPNGKQRRLRKIGGFAGWAIQHEVDHLDGILFTERIRDLSTLQQITEDEVAEAQATEVVSPAAANAENR